MFIHKYKWTGEKPLKDFKRQFYRKNSEGKHGVWMEMYMLKFLGVSPEFLCQWGSEENWLGKKQKLNNDVVKAKT